MTWYEGTYNATLGPYSVYNNTRTVRLDSFDEAVAFVKALSQAIGHMNITKSEENWTVTWTESAYGYSIGGGTFMTSSGKITHLDGAATLEVPD